MSNIEHLEENYYNFLINSYLWNYSRREWEEEATFNNHQKKEFFEVFKELVDTSIKTVECLTEEETYIVRKWIGVDGKDYPTIKSLSDDIDVPYGRTNYIIHKANDKMYHRILRGFANLEEAVLNGDISKEEICSLPICILYDLYSRIPKRINPFRYKTIGDLINEPLEDYYIDIGSRGIEILADYIHKLGLVFKGEKPVEDRYEYLGFNKNIDINEHEDINEQNIARQINHLRILHNKLKTISEQEAKYDEQIYSIILKKQELQKSKAEILNKINNINLKDVSLEEAKITKKYINKNLDSKQTNE